MADNLRSRMLAGETLGGTFVKTPAHDVIEVLALSGLDFVCFDAEHAAWDRARTDTCLAMARALGLPALVRVPWGRPELIQSALDSGATGIIVPHVSTPGAAQDVARAARFVPGGRGFAGSTRWAGLGSQSMADVLAQSKDTVVIAMIEEPEGVEQAEAIAATDGIDALMIGPADLSVALGKTDTTSAELAAAYDSVGAACKRAGKAFATWAPTPEIAQTRMPAGVTMFLLASDHTWMLNGARAAATALRQG